jgi:glucosamine--fructose-6-phosphate aminotransferase (isomerizing)
VGSTAADVAKEVAIFRAHKAAPIVVASEGDRAFTAALAVLTVPETHPRLGFLPSTMVGHLFGYEAALAIDAQALPLREVRAAIDEAVAGAGGDLHGARAGEGLLRRLRPAIAGPAGVYLDGLRSGAYNGHLEAGTAVRLAGQFRYALGISPIDGYQIEFGKVGTPGVVLEDLSAGLTAAIEELTRPVDAIKHQAKTVTVGISRSDESLLQVPLVAALLGAGSPRDRLTYSTLRSLGELDAAVAEVVGSTRYGLDHGEDLDRASLVVVDRGGISTGLPSRVDRDPRLRGTKALVAREQELMVARGRSDGRLVIIVPETKDGVTTGLQLLHVVLVDHLPAATARAVLQGYRRRYQALKDAVTETEDVFRDDLLEQQDVADLLTVPILDLADHWRS